ncbi:MAG: S8 family serine peptidase [Planctomycetota bacterium]
MSCGLLMLALVGCGGGGGGGNKTRQSSAAVPEPPRRVRASEQNGNIFLEWKQSADATSYNVYGDLVPNVGRDPDKLIGNVVERSATIQGPKSGTVFLTVTAVNDGGESEPSREVSVTLGGGLSDPLLGEQWHLRNDGQSGGVPGEDVHAIPVWQQGITGGGVRIAVVDDGVEIAHEDLAQNVAANLSFNYVNGSSDPTGGAHGTCCAGVAAAVGNNPFGGRGAAFEASIVGYNLLQALTSDNVVDAMTRNVRDVSISTNSWGSPDGLGIPQPSESSWKQAVISGLNEGRGGLGTVYLWAAGNGAQSPDGFTTDNSNLDGQANFFGVIAVAAVGDDGVRAFYSEQGANLWISAPSQGNNSHAITTVDRTGELGFNTGSNPNDFRDLGYTNTFNGTSSATPLVAGVVALMLQANPALTARDARMILALSARQNDPTDGDWTRNAAGHLVNHKYGFGVVDAEAAVAMARNWPGLAPLKIVTTDVFQPNLPIPDNDATGVSFEVKIGAGQLEHIEFVTILFDADDHTFGGDLLIELTSPSGTTSILAEPHAMPQGSVPYDDFLFGSARHLDESAAGIWTITVRDLAALDTGTFKTCALEFIGR